MSINKSALCIVALACALLGAAGCEDRNATTGTSGTTSTSPRSNSTGGTTSNSTNPGTTSGR